ncbi:hypothetical protein OSB04_014565 [Centaurea solstitialis]|uniref:Cyclin-like domain-containing protein n=1 Tax=Centaurea solstitialis TaxID=347529 RepID=A0AA38WFP6_9ASTR|nr:hypothetical protein OSB04_014565 [Centaurea solstitialis]
MSLARPHHAEHNQVPGDFRSSFGRNHPHMYNSASTAFTTNRRYINNNHRRSYNNSHDFSNESGQQPNVYSYIDHEVLPSYKRRKFSATNWESYGTSYNQSCTYGYSPSSSKITSLPPVASDANARASTSTSCKRDRSRFEDEDAEFMSRDQIERFSPSRKDGIDVLQETHLRYSYCAFLQNLGIRLELPQTTIGTAMVLCHRFFVRRSHASHDRFLIATAALFLAAKSEETPCPLNNVLRVSSEIFHKQDFNLLCYLLPMDWFDQYRERVIEAEQMVLTTLNFELNVQHPYGHLTSILDKLGLAQSLLVNLALSLVSEGLRSSLWLQFKPHQIAAGAAYLAARSLNMDLTACQNVWQECGPAVDGAVLEHNLKDGRNP